MFTYPVTMSRGRDLEEAQPFFREDNIRSKRREEENVFLEDYSDEKFRKYYSEQIQQSRYRHLLIAFCVSVVVVALVVVLIYATTHTSFHGDDHDHKKYGHIFKTAAVAADSEQCSVVGTSILKRGGNAVDATIAGLLCSGLTSAHSMGIGGGFFMTIYNRTKGEATTIDARETAPAKATKDMYKDNPEGAYLGGLSIAIPGEIRGYWQAHQKYGSLPWNVLFEDTIKMAEEGFPCPGALAQAFWLTRNDISNQKMFTETYMNPKTGKFFKKGEMVKMPKLAHTLKRIAEEGAYTFYNGSLADDIIKDLRQTDSIITKEDLRNYVVKESPGIAVPLEKGVNLLSLGLPSSGPLLAFILNIISGYNFTSKDIANDKNETLTYHRIVEAFKFAYALRSELGDENTTKVEEIVRNLTSRSYADAIRTEKITDDRTHNTSYYGGAYLDRVTTGTCQLSVIDQYGNAVSTTSTVNAQFGSKRMGNLTGIIFNNEMDDFSSPNQSNIFNIPPSAANFISPGKRPLSSMCPSILVNHLGDVIGVHGAAGGSKITTAVAWVIAHNLWLGLNIQEAVEIVRLHHQLLPPYLFYEELFKNKAVLQGLKAKGHHLKPYGFAQSVSQAISVSGTDIPIGKEGHEIYACSDYRKGGIPDGF